MVAITRSTFTVYLQKIRYFLVYFLPRGAAVVNLQKDKIRHLADLTLPIESHAFVVLAFVPFGF